MTSDPSPTADLLWRFRHGDRAAHSILLDRLGDELHHMAEAQLRQGQGDVLLQPTMLVNEAWIRLAAREGLSFDNRRAFLAFASKVMRNLLVDAARARLAEKRGPARERISVSDDALGLELPSVELLDVENALAMLEERDPESAQVVELRFFGGLEHRDIAETLGLSERTVDRRWRFARAWLRTRLTS